MFKIVTSNSTVIALHDRLYKKKNGHVIASSTLDENWLKNFKEVKLDKVRFLNVSRVNPEKGIYEFLEMFKKIKIDAEISIIGKTKSSTLQKKFQSIIGNNKNIKFPGYISDRQLLIDTYDKHNILILNNQATTERNLLDWKKLCPGCGTGKKYNLFIEKFI